MRFLIDTNIFLDALMERTPFDKAAKELLLRAEQGGCRCLFTINSLTDIFYVYRKSRDIKSAASAIKYLLKTYEAVAVNADDCEKALTLPIPDFEDALLTACAMKSKADFIVSRDREFAQLSPVHVINADEAVKLLGG
jgi:predicted nucleic acid-binding protein